MAVSFVSVDLIVAHTQSAAVGSRQPGGRHLKSNEILDNLVGVNMRHGSDNDWNAYLVVVIPGIGGSVLESPRGAVLWEESPTEEVLWEARPGAVWHFLRHPDSLANDVIARPVGLIKGLKLFPGITVVHGYHELMRAIGEAVGVIGGIDMGHPDNQNLDAHVVAFPYDFRRSIVESAEKLDKQIDLRLTHLRWKNQPDRVIIIAHSMGGLIARYWVAQENWNLCRAIITLGTPHRGAPKAFDYLVNGPPWWTFGGRELRDLLRDWPSIYQLVPRYKSIEEIRSQHNGGTETLKLYPKDLRLPGVQEKGVQDKVVAAFEVHREIEEAWERNAAETHCVAYVGRGHGTLLKASWDGQRLISTKERPSWLTKDPEERGDGTVPELSATPIEQGYHADPKFLTERHGGLVTAPECISELTRILKNIKPGNRAGRVDDLPLMIGFDLEDSYLRGCPVDVQARLTPRTHPTPPETSLTFVLTCNGNFVDHGRLERGAGGVWSTRFTDLATGAYQIRVDAVPRDIFQLSASEWFFVLDESPPERDLPRLVGERR